MPRERQLESLRLIKGLVDRQYGFKDRDEARDFFTRVIGLYKNWNYRPPEEPSQPHEESQVCVCLPRGLP